MLQRAQLMLQKHPHIVCEDADAAVAGTLHWVLMITKSHTGPHRLSLGDRLCMRDQVQAQDRGMLMLPGSNPVAC